MCAALQVWAGTLLAALVQRTLMVVHTDLAATNCPSVTTCCRNNPHFPFLRIQRCFYQRRLTAAQRNELIYLISIVMSVSPVNTLGITSFPGKSFLNQVLREAANTALCVGVCAQAKPDNV